jgi:UPF0271 protein
MPEDRRRGSVIVRLPRPTHSTMLGAALARRESLRVIDINCDLGESFGNWSMGNDAEIMPEITTANVACGFHAGDPVTMLGTVALAAEHGVAIGAHPGLPDLLGFGRRRMVLTPDDAGAYILYQVGALREGLRLRDLALHHIKPHGAFFEVLRDQPGLAEAAIDAVSRTSPDALIYWPAPTEGAAFCDAARARGMRVVGEVYPDLSYDAEGRLMLQRSKQHTDVEQASEQMRTFLETGSVRTVEGTLVALDAESACVHGDGPNAVQVARAVRRAITEAGCEVRAIEPAVQSPATP